MKADTIEDLKATIKALEAQRDAYWAGYKPKQDKRTENWGYFAGACTTTSFVPQVIVLWRHAPHAAPDVSLLAASILTIGVAVWSVVGRRMRAKSVIIANVITCMLSGSIVLYKLLHG